MKMAVEIVACLIMIGGVTGVFMESIWNNRGIGIRAIQLLTVLLLLPTVLILALEGILTNQTTAMLLGVVLGYILSGIGKDEADRTMK